MIERFDRAGTLTSVSESHGNVVTSKWYADADIDDQLVQVLTDEASGRKLVRIYRHLVDAASGAQAWRLTAIQDDPSLRPTDDETAAPPRAHVFEYQSSAPFALKQSTDPTGATRSFTFAKGKLVRSCDGNGACAETTFGTAPLDRRVVRQLQPSGTVVSLDWTATPEVDLTVSWGVPGSGEQHVQKYLHAPTHRITRTYPVDVQGTAVFSSIEYDAAGHKTREVRRRPRTMERFGRFATGISAAANAIL